MSTSTLNLDGVLISPVSFEELVADVSSSLRDPRGEVYVGFYAALLWRVFKNPEYRDLLGRSHLLYPDGMGTVFACRVLGGFDAPRLATTDIWLKLARVAGEMGTPVNLIGSSASAAAFVANELERNGVNVLGHRSGFFPSPEDRAKVAGEIAASEPSLVFVGMGAGAQEDFCALIKANPGGSNHVFFTVGGLFDHVSGVTSRAPLWVQRSGFEWAWRVAQEPRRLAKRYLVGNSYFVLRVIIARMRRGAA